uniref:Uncharacterized protein n=1 Tax=Triticum urartu TaxID=4572 RepID=A0A8R7U5Q0_TRIUA
HHALRPRLRLPQPPAVRAPPPRHGRRQLHRRVSNCMEANLQRWCLATLHTQSDKQSYTVTTVSSSCFSNANIMSDLVSFHYLGTAPLWFA